MVSLPYPGWLNWPHSSLAGATPQPQLQYMPINESSQRYWLQTSLRVYITIVSNHIPLYFVPQVPTCTWKALLCHDIRKSFLCLGKATVTHSLQPLVWGNSIYYDQINIKSNQHIKSNIQKKVSNLFLIITLSMISHIILNHPTLITIVTIT